MVVRTLGGQIVRPGDPRLERRRALRRVNNEVWDELVAEGLTPTPTYGGTMKFTDLPQPGYYAAQAREAWRVVRAGGSFRFCLHGSYDPPVMDLEAWGREYHAALNRRINRAQCECPQPPRAGGRPAKRHGIQWEFGRKFEPDYQCDLRRDQRLLHEYLRHRRVVRGSGFNLKETRRRFPQVQARFTEND